MVLIACVLLVVVAEVDGIATTQSPFALALVLAWPFLGLATFGRFRPRISGLLAMVAGGAMMGWVWVRFGLSTAQLVVTACIFTNGPAAVSGLLLEAFTVCAFTLAAGTTMFFTNTVWGLHNLRPMTPAGLFAALACSALINAAIGVLTYRFSRALKVARDELAVLRSALEDRVADRTAALASTNAAISRFVPREFLQALGHDDVTTARLGDVSAREVTVLFADIRNFTSLSERMSPEQTFAFLNACLSKLGPHIRSHSGFVDKYIGDAIMALFPGSPADAVRAGLGMQREVARFNSQGAGGAPLAIGVGIHVGRVMMGTIGEAERFEATVISDAVNLTARLESLTKQLGCAMLISEHVFATLDGELRKYTRRVGTFVVKGRAQPVALYEVFASDSDASRDGKLRTRDAFDAMLAAFADDRADEALALANDLRDASPDDGPVNWWCMRLLAESATSADGVPSSRGIIRLDEK